jgi:hypothetical protein
MVFFLAENHYLCKEPPYRSLSGVWPYVTVRKCCPDRRDVTCRCSQYGGDFGCCPIPYQLAIPTFRVPMGYGIYGSAVFTFIRRRLNPSGERFSLPVQTALGSTQPPVPWAPSHFPQGEAVTNHPLMPRIKKE